MLMICRCCGLWRIERVVLDDREVLRVTRRDYLVAYCRTVAEVAQHVDRGQLYEPSE